MSVTKKQHRAAWWRQVHQWHWISAALCLVGMLLFAFTGITLNHASAIEAEPVIASREALLPQSLLPVLQTARAGQSLPVGITRWLDEELAVDVGGRALEWSAQELYIALPRPGGDGWLSIDLGSGEIVQETTRRGWVAVLNDLHKGRHSGAAWSWFIDLFSLACVIFSLTGLFLLHLHGARRPMTWPVVGLGLLLPLFLFVVFVH